MTERLAYIDGDGDLALANWDAGDAAGCQTRKLLSRDNPALRGAGGAAPRAFAAPAWSPEGERLSVSVVYAAAPGQPGATLVLVGLDGSEPRTLYSGTPGLDATIAPGLPHYVNWSPAGDQIVLLTQTVTGMALFLAGADQRGVPAALTSGAPLFSAWSPDGQALLIHAAADLLLMEQASAPNLETLARNATAFQVPAWSPREDRFALIRRRGASASLNLMDTRGHETALHAFPGTFGALAWSPAGDRLACSPLVSNDPPRYHGLWLDSLDGSDAQKLHDETILAFFWSPDGRRLAYLAPTLSQRQLNWNVIDLQTRAIRRYARFYPGTEFTLQLSFFEQYAPSHRLWSPAGTTLVLNGRAGQNGVPPELTESRIYVQPLGEGAIPHPLALGTYPAWAPV